MCKKSKLIRELLVVCICNNFIFSNNFIFISYLPNFSLLDMSALPKNSMPGYSPEEIAVLKVKYVFKYYKDETVVEELPLTWVRGTCDGDNFNNMMYSALTSKYYTNKVPSQIKSLETFK